MVRNEDVQEVLFRGYENEFRTNFINRLEMILDGKGQDSGLLNGLDITNEATDGVTDDTLPIGSVVKSKKDDCFIIVGYNPTDTDMMSSGEDYEVVPFPFTMRFPYNSEYSKEVLSLLKNTKGYNRNVRALFKNDIKQLIFKGYFDDLFSQVQDAFKE